MENESISEQIIQGLSETAKGLEDGEINRCPNCNHIYDKRNPTRVVTRSISRRLMAQAGFAAGPWQDGEPPNDPKSDFLCVFPDSYGTRSFCEDAGWIDENHSQSFVDGCLRHAKINLAIEE